MTQPAPAPNRNRFLILFRDWHTWLGVATSAVVLALCITGLYMNTKDLWEMKEHVEGAPPPALLRADLQLASLAVTPQRALELAREHLGEAPLEKIELKDEHGALVWKVKTRVTHGMKGGMKEEGKEVLIGAADGKVVLRDGGYGETVMGPDGTPAEAGFRWGKFMNDLHTGELFGTAGRRTVDLSAVILVGLTITGVYLWAVAWSRRRKAKKSKPAARPTVAAPPPASAQKTLVQ